MAVEREVRRSTGATRSCFRRPRPPYLYLWIVSFWSICSIAVDNELELDDELEEDEEELELDEDELDEDDELELIDDEDDELELDEDELEEDDELGEEDELELGDELELDEPMLDEEDELEPFMSDTPFGRNTVRLNYDDTNRGTQADC